MKSKILLSLVTLFCLANILHAQINQGKILLGGTISYSGNHNNVSSPSSTNPYNENLYANIQLGKFIKENTAVGLLLVYGCNKYSTSTNPSNKNVQYAAGAFYRKYKGLARNFYFFGEGDLSFNYSKNNFQYYDVSTNSLNTAISKTNGISLLIVPGISYAVWKKMQVELSMLNIFSIGYSHSKTHYSATNSLAYTDEKANSFSASANLSPNLLSNFGVGFKFIL